MIAFKTSIIMGLIALIFMVFASATQYHSVGVSKKQIDAATELCGINEGLTWLGVDGDAKCANGALFHVR